jgi:hypothetical protein
MRRSRTINPHQTTHRQGLRTLGLLLTVPGAVLTLVGFGSLLSSFGSFGGPPQYFWCAFVGLPMLGIGGNLLRLGYLGTITRYVAGEAAPVAADTVDYLARNTRDAVRTVAAAVGEGLRVDGKNGAETVPCPACSQPGSADARFCSQCGAAMQCTVECPGCRLEQPAAARFCSGCGTKLAEVS